MNETVRARPLPAGDALDELNQGDLTVGVGDVFERLWHLFISMRTGLALMLGLALFTLIGTVVIQAPVGLQSDAAAYDAWLDSVRPKYGGWTGAFDMLGLFNIFSSFWFRGTILLLATSIMACSVNRAPRLWKQAVHPRPVVSAEFFAHARMSETIVATGTPEEARAILEAHLAGQRYRTIVTEVDGGLAIYADRFRWAPFGTVIAHLSLIFILGGAMFGATGFRDANFAIAVGSTLPVGNGTNLSIKAMSFTDAYYDNGSPSDYASSLIVYDRGVQVSEKTIRVNDPLRVGDVTLYQSFFGPAADLVVRDTSGKVLYEQGVPLQWASSDDTKAIGQFQLPGQDLTVYVIGAASGQVDPNIRAGQIQLEVYQGANTETPAGLQVVDQGVPATLAGLEFTFVRERQYTGLIVARDPGAPIVWLGALLLLFGVAFVFFFPYGRLWVRIAGGRSAVTVSLAAVSAHDAGYSSAFGRLVDDVRDALSHGDQIDKKGR